MLFVFLNVSSFITFISFIFFSSLVLVDGISLIIGFSSTSSISELANILSFSTFTGSDINVFPSGFKSSNKSNGEESYSFSWCSSFIVSISFVTSNLLSLNFYSLVIYNSSLSVFSSSKAFFTSVTGNSLLSRVDKNLYVGEIIFFSSLGR